MNETEIQRYIDNLITYMLRGIKPDGSKLDEIEKVNFAKEINYFQNALRLVQSNKVTRDKKGTTVCKMPDRITKTWKLNEV